MMFSKIIIHYDDLFSKGVSLLLLFLVVDISSSCIGIAIIIIIFATVTVIIIIFNFGIVFVTFCFWLAIISGESVFQRFITGF